MPGTMTYVGFDVHARSTHAAAIDVMTGEMSGCGSVPGVEAPVEWLMALAGRCGRAMRLGRPGTGSIAPRSRPGCGMEVIAPGKTPRGAVDRVKTDRKDAELLARC